MSIGALHHRITFRQKVETKGASMGDISESWDDDSNDFEVSAELVSSTSREYFEAQRRNQEMTILFRIRYRAGIDAQKHRILFSFEPASSPPDVQIYQIFTPRSDNLRRWMLIEAKEMNQ